MFFTQSKLEQWIEDGEVLFEGETLTIFAQNRSFRLETAIRITSLLDGEDSSGWLGQVLTAAQIAEAGAEHYRDSVIKGDTAYQCEEGFVGLEGEAPVDVSELQETRTTISDEPRNGASESDMLADFLLKHL